MEEWRAAARLGPIVVVRDDRPDARPLDSGRFLARHAATSLTLLEVGTRRSGPEADILHVPISGDDRWRQVADHVDHRGESLVLVPSHGGGPPAGPLFDECAEGTLERARRPVLVFGPHAAPITRPPAFVVALDASCGADVVEPTLTTIVGALGASLIVAQLLPIDPWPGDDADPVADAGRRLANAWRGRLPTRLVRISTWDRTTELLHLVSEMADAVLVTVAPRWPDPADHWHATARRLVRHAPCPVLVVPRDAVSPTVGRATGPDGLTVA